MSGSFARGWVLPGLATVANFGAVLVGLWAISRHSNGDDQVALLNLWAVWGISLGLLGQIGLLSGVFDRKSWFSQRVLILTGAAMLVCWAVLLPVRDALFPASSSWWIYAGVLAGAMYLIGRQRAALTVRERGAVVLAVTALENVLRAAALTGVLLTSRPALGAFAIAAPAVVSFVLFSTLGRGQLTPVPVSMTTNRSTAVSLLAGSPAVLAYAVVPLLTLVGNTTDLDLVAVAATLVRGPLIVAGFLAPKFLERVPVLEPVLRRRITLGVVAVVGGLLVASTLSGSSASGALVLSSAGAAIAALSAYLMVVLSAQNLTAKSAVLAAFTAACVFLVVGVSLPDQATSWSFLGVTLASLAIVGFVHFARPTTHDEHVVQPSVLTKEAA